jgi:23S rRNA (cytidine1920-2'-O)/16S rRNA (cytidine1409-2'-O)-methyltransferase
VTVVDRTNFRTVDPASLDPPFDLVAVDVSFISVSLLAANLAAVGGPATDYLVLVKPQFEAGRDAVGRGGLIREPAEWQRAVGRVAEYLFTAGIGFAAALPSSITGATGNREFFLHGRWGAPEPPDLDTIEAAVHT